MNAPNCHGLTAPQPVAVVFANSICGKCRGVREAPGAMTGLEALPAFFYWRSTMQHHHIATPQAVSIVTTEAMQDACAENNLF